MATISEGLAKVKITRRAPINKHQVSREESRERKCASCEISGREPRYFMGFDGGVICWHCYSGIEPRKGPSQRKDKKRNWVQ